jgi:hypothetical protein
MPATTRPTLRGFPPTLRGSFIPIDGEAGPFVIDQVFKQSENKKTKASRYFQFLSLKLSSSLCTNMFLSLNKGRHKKIILGVEH